jgi:hypothetical protein
MMETKQPLDCRYFVSYSGVNLPLNLITPVEADGLEQRITYFRGYYDAQGQLVAVEKVVYGEVDEEPRVMEFE